MNVLEKILEEIEIEEQKQREVCKDIIKSPGYRIYEKAVGIVKEIIRYHINVVENDGWIPADSDNQPKDEERVLVSFENFNEVLTARYKAEEEGGTFLLDADDTDESFVSHDLYVSAWQPLPEPYRGE